MTRSAAAIVFKAKLSEPAMADLAAVLNLPKDASTKLPSKGMVSVEGTINGSAFAAALEPDGHGGHLLRLDSTLQKTVGAKVGDEVSINMAPANVEPEPKVPTDLQRALDTDKEAKALWLDITTLARRDWIHWVTSAKQAETRARRIEQTKSKLKDGKRRPCCFNYQCAVVSYEPLKSK